MESKITNEELCDILLDVFALRDLAKFIYENGDVTVEKGVFRIYERTLSAVSEKIAKHVD
jgi:hypothetical protein